MYVQGLFEESPDTVEGTGQHDRSEKRRKKKQPEKETQASCDEDSDDESLWPQLPRELSLGNNDLGLVGKLDAVEETVGQWIPVEAKHSAAPKGDRPFFVEEEELSASAWGNDQIQLCGQGLLLTANGYPSSYGYLYYRKTKTRVRIDFNPVLVSATRKVIDSARQCFEGEIPQPLLDSEKCLRCSMSSVCLPEEMNLKHGLINEPRRIIPGRDDLGVVYVHSQGTYVGKSGQCISISTLDGSKDTIPIKDVSALVLFGNIQVSTQALQFLMASGRSVTFLSQSGRYFGTAESPLTKNPVLRRKQAKIFDDSLNALYLSKSIVIAKIKNQRTLLRRNGSGDSPDLERALSELADCMEKAESTDNVDSLRGLEGYAARCYFGIYPSLLKNEALKALMKGRSKRPPKDPVNAMLSFGYSILARDFRAAINAAGMDPMWGFYHIMEAGRPALALDMMETFRPLIVDSLVLRLINMGVLTEKDFWVTPANALMTPAGRKSFLAGYEQRMDEMITHPEFNYRLSYRRVLELEARLLARFIEGELREYSPLTTR